jgi:hypothetical protein
LIKGFWRAIHKFLKSFFWVLSRLQFRWTQIQTKSNEILFYRWWQIWKNTTRKN